MDRSNRVAEINAVLSMKERIKRHQNPSRIKLLGRQSSAVLEKKLPRKDIPSYLLGNHLIMCLYTPNSLEFLHLIAMFWPNGPSISLAGIKSEKILKWDFI